MDFRQFAGSAVRTYGYPLVLSFVLRAMDTTGLAFVVLLFAFQFLTYVARVFPSPGRLRPRVLRPPGSRSAVCCRFLRPHLPSESLSESLSLTLLVFAAGAW